MTLTELKYAIAVARLKHFGRAAEYCHISQPSLSVAVKKLEDELGVKLFERRRGELAVTPIGQLVIDQAQKVIEEAEHIHKIAEQGKDPLSSPLRLGVIFTVAPYLIPSLVHQMLQKLPEMPLNITEDYTANLLERLRGGLIVSAQAYPGEPMRDPRTMDQVAQACVAGGAVGAGAEKSVTKQNGVELRVKLDDGRVVNVTQTLGDDYFVPGQRVRVLFGADTRVRPL